MDRAFGLPASCRWRSDWHPCPPASQCSASMHSLLHFFTLYTTCGREWVLRRAGFPPCIGWTIAISIRNGQFQQWLRQVRRRPSLSIRWKRSCRRLFSAEQERSFISSRQSVAFGPEYQRLDTKTGFDPNEVTSVELTCGGDRRYLFVGRITVAACSTR